MNRKTDPIEDIHERVDRYYITKVRELRVQAALYQATINRIAAYFSVKGEGEGTFDSDLDRVYVTNLIEQLTKQIGDRSLPATFKEPEPTTSTQNTPSKPFEPKGGLLQ